MFILRDLLHPPQAHFSDTGLGRERFSLFAYTLLAVIVPFTSSITSNLRIQSRKTIFKLEIWVLTCWYVRVDCRLTVWNGAASYGLPVYLVSRSLPVILSKTYNRERQVFVFPTFDTLGKKVVFPLI